MGKNLKKKWTPAKPAKPRRPAPPAGPTAPAAEEVPEITGSEADYEALLPAARKLDLRDVTARRIDVGLACHNAAKGAAAVLKRKGDIEAHLPEVQVSDIEQISRIASALAFASLRVDQLTTPDKGIRQMLARARVLRRLLLSSAVALAEAGVFDKKKIDKVIAGKGPIDTADDIVVLASEFTAHARKVQGKTAVTAQQVKEAAELGTQLRSLLKPKRAAKKDGPTDEMTAALEIRDRFWALLVLRYDVLWRAGAYLFGKDEIDARVPALQGYAGRRRARADSGASDGESPSPPGE